MIQIAALDHLVLTVTNTSFTREFYSDCAGNGGDLWQQRLNALG